MKNLFNKIKISPKTEDTDLLTWQLEELGAQGFEFGDDNTVTIYIPQVNDHSKIIAFLEDENLKYTTTQVDEADWENEWKRYFKPFAVGERLVIKPSWEEYVNTDDKIVLEIDPASAFGTGQHATTRLALELLEKHIKKADSVFDVGCGSGILSAAAMLLGTKSVTAVDICANAVRITEETLQRNSINNYSTFCGNIITDESLREQIGKSYDVVIANIVADVIIAMSALLPEFVGDRLILSGIFKFFLSDVLEAIEPYFSVIDTRESEDWVALVCVKK